MYNSYLFSVTVPLYFFLHQSIISVASNSPGLHDQLLDHIAINCGSFGHSTTEDGRKWIGDIGSKYITLLHGPKWKMIRSKAFEQPFPSDLVPYTTARLSRWPFTYIFRVTPGQKFIRLHFYPASYQVGFKRSTAVLTVKAGPYTLLNNFNASHTADALGTQSLAREFCVTIEENQPLVITFSPSRSGNSNDVYAFVNGIEVISIPAALYHTREGNPAAQIIGKNDRFTIDKSIALEKVHRLNIGGNSISPREDAGMFRDWYEDSNYLLKKSSVKPVTIPPYSAPQKVYQTSWLLVPDMQANKTEFNFTWRLPVDLGFRYLLRLHFCEHEYYIKESGWTESSIFVNEQVAEPKGDLIKWSGGNGVAVYKDYVVMMEGNSKEAKDDLLIALRPHNHEWTEPIDATLKGLEVFKLREPDKTAAAVNPVPLARASTSPRHKKLLFASGGNAFATRVVIFLTVLNIMVYQLSMLGENSAGRNMLGENNEGRDMLGENSAGRNMSPSPSDGGYRRFSLAELISVTSNFGDESVIGSGGFGKVYKALIDDGARTVAIKRLNLKSKQGTKELWTEIEMISKLRHTHLISLLGYCHERNEMILVYEFMEHGTLADHLYQSNNSSKHNGTVGHVSWEQRLNICIGAAHGLEYLHTCTRHGIIHRDVKTTNILLDINWIAKISDFGLCKVGATSHSHTHVSTDGKVTFGYLDPEYFLTRRLTKKSDVYAFGVVMLEMLCGRPPVDMWVEEEQRDLVLWAKKCIKEKKLDQLIDPSLRGQISPQCLRLFAEVANKCLDSRPKGRPTMAIVVVSLECTLALENQCIVPSREEEERDANLNDDGALNKQFHESTRRDDSLLGGATPSSSTLLQYSANSQCQNKSKVKVSKVFHRSIELLAKGADIGWKKKRRYDFNSKQSLSAHTSTRCLSVGSNIPRYFSSSAENGGNESHPKRKILPTSNLRIFSFLELKFATKNFSNDRLLGEGGFGKVYKGWLDENNDSRLVCAIKNLTREGMQGFAEWRAELNFLGSLAHPNLVKLLGYCREDAELLLVYEYMPNGSLENHLFGRGSSVQPLPWDVRLNILIGAARGVAFLHTSETQISYRYFKTSNILLDGSYNAKMSDFGVARMGPLSSESHATTRVMGTGHLYVKSDVYGFGVVLVEMLTGLRALDNTRPIGKRSLVEWVKPYLSRRRKLKNIMDSRLEGRYPPEAALHIAQLARKCLGTKPNTRPSMEIVLETLERLDGTPGKTEIGRIDSINEHGNFDILLPVKGDF